MESMHGIRELGRWEQLSRDNATRCFVQRLAYSTRTTRRKSKERSPGCPLLSLRLRLVPVWYRTGQETAAAAHCHRLLEAQRTVARLHRWQMLSWWRMLHASRERHVHVRAVSRRSVQLGEIDVRRFQLQSRRFVGRWRQ